MVQSPPLTNMRAYVKMLKETREAVQTALKQGKTFEEMKRAGILDPWKKFAGDFITEDAYLEDALQLLDRPEKRQIHPAQLGFPARPCRWRPVYFIFGNTIPCCD